MPRSIRIIASNEIWLTNGTDGLSGIPGPMRASLPPIEFNLLYLCVVAALVTVLFILIDRLSHSPFARVLRAIREDEQVAAVAGKHVIAVQGAGLCVRQRGARPRRRALRPLHVATSRPTSSCRCSPSTSSLPCWSAGSATIAGAVLGAVAVVTFLESTRFIVPLIPGISHVQGAALREFLISVSLIVILRFRSGGLLPEAREHPVLPAGRTRRPRATI